MSSPNEAGSRDFVREPTLTPSGIRRVTGSPSELRVEREDATSAPDLSLGAEESIREANRELERLHPQALELPLVTLAAQRDAAIRREHSERARYAAALEEQDRFIAFLVTEHENRLTDVQFEQDARISAMADELREVRWQLEEAGRRLEDVQDEARKESFRVREALERTQSLLQERTEEAHRLRVRLHETEEALAQARSRASRPPA